MNKRDLVAAASKKVNVNQRDIQLSLEAAFACILETLERGEKIEIQEFGMFFVKEWGERKARNPNTGEAILLAPRKVVKFKVTKRSPLNIQKGTYKRL